MTRCHVCDRPSDIISDDGSGVCYDCCYRYTAATEVCHDCDQLTSCTGGQLNIAEKRIADLQDQLKTIFGKVSLEVEDYATFSWCAGCGAKHDANTPSKNEPCKNDCWVAITRQMIKSAE